MEIKNQVDGFYAGATGNITEKDIKHISEKVELHREKLLSFKGIQLPGHNKKPIENN